MRPRYYILTVAGFSLVVAGLWSQTRPSVPLQSQLPLNTALGNYLCVGVTATAPTVPVIGFCPPPTSGPGGAVPHLYSDQIPTQQTDGSWLFVNPLALISGTVDVPSIQVTLNGITLTKSVSPNGTFDYTLDAANPLHVIPSPYYADNQSSPNWSGMYVRGQFTVTK
jgi:hypothetical protein